MLLSLFIQHYTIIILHYLYLLHASEGQINLSISDNIFVMEQQEQSSQSAEEAQFQRLKFQLIQIWCVFLFHSEHRCIINHICSETASGREVTLRTLSEFKNSLNIVHQLKMGFLVTITESRAEKTSTVRINNQFFGQLPQLIERIKNKINPELEKIKQFNPQEKKKVCSVCKIEKTESEINFMGPKCACATPQFVDIKQDPEKKARYDQLQRLLTEIISRKKKFDELEEIIQRKKRERNELKEKKLSDYEKFLEKEGLARIAQKTKIEKNFENLNFAIKLFSPNREYEKVNELKVLQELRKKGNRSPFI